MRKKKNVGWLSIQTFSAELILSCLFRAHEIIKGKKKRFKYFIDNISRERRVVQKLLL